MQSSMQRSTRIDKGIPETLDEAGVGKLIQEQEQEQEQAESSNNANGAPRVGTQLRHKRQKANGSVQVVNNSQVASTSTTIVKLSDNHHHVEGQEGSLILWYMNDMPLDIIYEVFGHLEPRDLLYLSWSCKRIRTIVINKRAKFLWARAFDLLKSLYEAPPPPCPIVFNYIQYTSFLYEKCCTRCQKGIAEYESWGLRLKACRNCLSDNYFIIVKSRFGLRHTISSPRGSVYPNEVQLDKMQVADLQDEYLRRAEGQLQYRKWKAHGHLPLCQVTDPKDNINAQSLDA